MNRAEVQTNGKQTGGGRTPLRVSVYLADQNPHRDRSLGITSMTRSLLDELSQRAALQLTLISSKSSFGSVGRTETNHRLPFRTDRAVGRILGDLFHPILARTTSDLWYYPKGYLSLFSRPSAPLVGTMHDAILQHYADHYPETRTPRAFRYWIRVMKNSLQRFDTVMTVSQHAKSQLEQFCQRHRIQSPPIHVTYESSSWESHRGRRWPKREEVVHLASPAPHKRTNHLLDMWGQLQSEGRELPRLRLIGSLDDYGKQKRTELNCVSFTPPQDEASLVEAVGSARALLLPSEIEGFGLPALEAYYVGTPVCYVAETSVGEVVTEAGSFGAFELADAKSLYNALDAALGQSSGQMEAISDTLFCKFSNQTYADRVLETFSKVAGR